MAGSGRQSLEFRLDHFGIVKVRRRRQHEGLRILQADAQEQAFLAVMQAYAQPAVSYSMTCGRGRGNGRQVVARSATVVPAAGRRLGNSRHRGDQANAQVQLTQKSRALPNRSLVYTTTSSR